MNPRAVFCMSVRAPNRKLEPTQHSSRPTLTPTLTLTLTLTPPVVCCANDLGGCTHLYAELRSEQRVFRENDGADLPLRKVGVFPGGELRRACGERHLLAP